MNDDVIDIAAQDAIVDGFQEGIKLLPHQVIGRKWMTERESGKKAGGILADDMGYACHGILVWAQTSHYYTID